MIGTTESSGPERIPTSLSDVSKHWAVYSIGSVLSKLSGFLLLPIYTRFLTPTEYGIKAMVVVSVNMMMIFLAQGIRVAVFRFYRDDDGKANPEVISTGIISAACLATLGVGIALSFSQSLARLMFGGPDYAYYLRLGLIAFFFSYILEIPLAYLQVMKRSIMFTAISVATLVMSVSLNILFVVFLRLGVAGILYTEIIANALVCLLLVGMTLREISCSFSTKAFLSMIRYGAPTLLVASGWLVINTADRLLLSRYGSLSEVGIYSLANQFAQVLLVVFIQPFLNVWGPGQFEVNRLSNAAELFWRYFHFFTSILIVSVFILAIFIEDVIKLVAAAPFWPAATLVPMLALTYGLMGVHASFNTGILIKRRTEWAGLILLASAGLNVLLNFLLIQQYLAVGAVVSRVVSLIAVVGMTYWVSQRLYPIEFRVSEPLKMFAYAAGLFAMSRYIPGEPIVMSALFKTALVLILVVLVLRSDVWREGDWEKLYSVGRGFLMKFQIGSGWRQ